MPDVVVINGIDITPKNRKTPTYVPSLYDVHKTFDVIKARNYDGIKGEYNNRMVVFTNFILGRKCVLLGGNRASGKTNLMTVASIYCTEKLIIAKGSDKADIRDTNINDCSHIVIPEINKVNHTFTEMMKDFGEGASSIYKYVDVYKNTKTITIDPKPFITSIADENDARLGAELISRLTLVNMDASIEQNKRVIEEKLLRAQNPYIKRDISQKDVRKCVDYVKSLPNIHDFKFIYLPGTAMLKAIPPLFTDSRRDTDKYLENTYGITLFHCHNRIIFTYENCKHVLVAPSDVWYNHIIFNKILVQSALKCNDTERKIIEILTDNRRKKKTLTEQAVIRLTVSAIHKILLGGGFTHSLPTVKKYCDKLADIGYTVRNDEVRPHTYEVNTTFTSEYETQIDWKVIVEECKSAVSKIFPDYADEYIKKYCTAPIVCKHPFTGEDMDILTGSTEIVKQEKTVKETKEGLYEEKDKTDTIREQILKLVDAETNVVDLLKHISDEYKIEEIEVEEHIQFLEKIGDVTTKGNKIQRL